MKINLTKHNFVRSPEDDFSDDGARFTCYKVGEVRVSKTTWNGLAFISGRYNGEHQLPYEVYSKLPHYAGMDRLNNYSINLLTEEDLDQLYEDCVAYNKEYEEAFANMNWPSRDEIKAARRTEINARKVELAKVLELATAEKLLAMDVRHLEWFKGNFDSLKSLANPKDTDDEYADRYYGRAYSLSITKPDYIKNRIEPSYDYKYCMQYLGEKIN